MTTDRATGGIPLIVVNPRAARLADPAARDRVIDEIAAAVEARYRRTPTVESGSLEAARSALAGAADAPIVVIAGGDGTVREAAEALRGSATPMAIVPGGTGNVLASALGIRGVGPAVAAIRSGRPKVLDLGRARWGPPGSGGTTDGAAATEERLFVVACGMGLDARIMAAAAHEWKRRIRFGAYVGAAFRELLRLESARFRIVADGEALEIVGYLVLVANAGDLIPGRVGPRQPIDPTDGKLDLIVLGGDDVPSIVFGAADLMTRAGEQHGRVIRRAVSEVTVEAEPAQPIETDGDPHPAGRLEANVLPGALTVMVRA